MRRANWSSIFKSSRKVFLWGLAVSFALSPIRGVRAAAPIRIPVSIAPEIRAEPVSGRILLLLSRTQKLSPGVNGTPVFGKNVDDLKPGVTSFMDEAAFGYPPRNLSDIPDGDYFVQAWLNVYTTFKRA